VQRLRLIGLVFVTAALGLIAAGCGSKDQPSTAEWVDGVCAAMVTWTNSLKSSAQSLQGGNLSEDSLKGAVDDVTEATDTLESDLEDLGKPESDSGQQAKEEIDQLSDQLSEGANSIENAADDVSGLNGVLAATTSITAALGMMANQISSTLIDLRQLPGGGLQDAVDHSKSCQELGNPDD
jgi:uncharacterized phage infection (PIP) family protein YhgE